VTTIDVEIETQPPIDVEIEERAPIEVEILQSPVSRVATIEILVTDPQGADVSVGDGLAYLRIPTRFSGWRLSSVAASLSEDGVGVTSVQLRRVRGGVDADMLSTPITLDSGETDSTTAATLAVIDTANDDVLTADQVAVDVDSAGTGAKGLLVEMTFSAQ